MKTTIDLPDKLLIAAKKKAAELRRPLRSLVEEGLRTVLNAQRHHRPDGKRKIRWVTVKGKLSEDLNLTSRAAMHDWLRRNR